MSKLTLIIITMIIVSGVGFYFWQKQNLRTVTIMVPDNINLYKEKMTQFVQTGGENPLATMKFNKKTVKVNIPQSVNLMEASVQAAAQEIDLGHKVIIVYFKIKHDTAYVLSNINKDGWAGVSVALAVINPLIKKTLLQFPEINKVIFAYAPN